MRQLNAGDIYAKSKLRKYGKLLRTHFKILHGVHKTNWFLKKL